MIGYASRTGTRKNLAALRSAGWRLIVSATGCLRSEGFRYGLDNGAWTAHQRGGSFDERLFSVALAKMGQGADWTVVPDIVGGGLESLKLSLRWLPSVLDATQVALIAVQDGMSFGDVGHLLGKRVGLFVGGSTPWKLSTIDGWAKLGRDAGCWVHVGRVNTVKRILSCSIAGVHSFDGTSASRYCKTLPKLDHARQQTSFGGFGAW